MAVSNAVAVLLDEYKRFSDVKMNDLFASDVNRAEKYTI